MKKSILKKLVLISCFFAILLTSCEKEPLEEDNANYISNIKKTKVNFADFKENKKAFDVFKNLNLTDTKPNIKNLNVQNATSYNFEINFNDGIHLSYHNLESYTFPITRVIDNGLLENIVISEHTDGKYYAKLLKYNLTPQEKIDLANDELKSIQNPIVTEMLGEYSFGNQIQSDCGWITITTITACVNGHTSTSQCNLRGAAAPSIKTITVAIDCNDGSGGGGGGTGDGAGGYYGNPFFPGGGGGYITPSFPNETTPTDYYENGISEPVLSAENSADVRNVNLFYQSLTPQQRQWIAADFNNLIIYNQLVQHQRDNAWSDDSKQFAKELIEDLVNFPTSEGNDGNSPDFNYDDYSNIQTQSQSLPGRNSFYNAFPKYGTSGMPAPLVYQLIAGTVLNSRINEPEKYKNACALRISRALNYSGNPIPVFYNNAGKQRTQKGGDNKNYILDAASLLAYMKKTFPNSNPMHLINKTPAEYKKAINGKWGIYIMLPRDTATFGASGHADFWSNTGCLSGCHFDKAKEIYFWELF